MHFRSAMCPNCDCIMKVDSASKTIFCTRCGSQVDAEGAFYFHDLRHADKIDFGDVDGAGLLVASGKSLLEEGRYDDADICFQKAIEQTPDDYYIWKLRAFTLESKVVNGFKQSFYIFNKEKKDVVENGKYLEQYKELCQTAVRYCPSDMTHDLAEEFNDRIREHFHIARRAFDEERKKYRLIVLAAALVAFLVIAMLFMR